MYKGKKMRGREEGGLKVRYSGEYLVQGRDTAIGDGRSARNTRMLKGMSGTKRRSVVLQTMPSHARLNWGASVGPVTLD